MKTFFLAALLLCASLLSAQQASGDVRVYSEGGDDELIHFYADNDFFIPVYVHVSFEELQNLSSNVDLPFGLRLEAETERVYLFSLKPGSGRRITFSYLYRYTYGDPGTVQPDEDYLYTFPYEHGTKQEITQGFHGEFSHWDDNSYAVDFDLSDGTKVFAAREGLVAAVKEDSNIGGTGAAYGKHGNFVLIMHDDGTMGNYVHLQQNGATVEPGDRVETGQFIGYSGNTGRSSGPHLHFDVRVPQFDGVMQSIPIRFKGIEGEAIEPEENVFYYSFHEGKAPFTVTYGLDLRNADFANYSAEATEANTIDIRTEQFDNSYVLFIANGFDYAIKAEVTLQLRNMTSTLSPPITIRLDAGEERFLTILRTVKGTSSARYSSSISYRRE